MKNNTSLTVKIDGMVKINGKKLNDLNVIKLNPYQKIPISFPVKKECTESSDFFPDDQNDNSGEGFGILIGDSNPIAIEVC